MRDVLEAMTKTPDLLITPRGEARLLGAGALGQPSYARPGCAAAHSSADPARRIANRRSAPRLPDRAFAGLLHDIEA